MISNENYQVSQGGALTIQATLMDTTGTPLVGYTGSETLATMVWPGGAQAVSYTPATTWVTPSLALIQIVFPAADSTALSAGRYQLLTRVTPPDSDPLDAYGCTLDVLQGPGTETPPTNYCQYSDLLNYGRSWLRQLQTDDDEAGFAEQLGRARSWLEDCGHNHYRVASMTMVVGSQAFGPRRSGARSTWLEEQFAANTLLVTDQIREACANYALYLICRGQIGVGGAAADYARLARHYRSEAEYLATTITLSLDTNGDGFPDVNIDLSCSDPMDA